MQASAAATVYRCRVRRGRILAIKWGMNPNSSSLGVDVTFLLAGATVLAAVTPVVGALLRWRRRVALEPTVVVGSAGAASGPARGNSR
jgi:hypothetical protein